MKTVTEFFTEQYGKSPDEMTAQGELMSPAEVVVLMLEYAIYVLKYTQKSWEKPVL